MEYNPKTTGLTYLRYQLARANKHPSIKFLSIPKDKANTIMEEIKTMKPFQEDWSLKSNSLKAGALVLGIDAKELRERLIHPSPSKLLSDLAEARTKIKMLLDAGDALARTTKYDSLIERWNSAKSL